MYVVDGLNVKRFVDGKLAKTIKGGVSKPIGIGVDLDCNLWLTNISQRNLTRVSPSGKVLGTATSGDLIAQDVAVGPKGDLYAYDSGAHAVVRFAEDRSKPATANVAGAVTRLGRRREGALHAHRRRVPGAGHAASRRSPAPSRARRR